MKLRSPYLYNECHRSTLGEMLTAIKTKFLNALFFGFTGTPVFSTTPENSFPMTRGVL